MSKQFYPDSIVILLRAVEQHGRVYNVGSHHEIAKAAGGGYYSAQPLVRQYRIVSKNPATRGHRNHRPRK